MGTFLRRLLGGADDCGKRSDRPPLDGLRSSVRHALSLVQRNRQHRLHDFGPGRSWCSRDLWNARELVRADPTILKGATERSTLRKDVSRIETSLHSAA